MIQEVNLLLSLPVRAKEKLLFKEIIKYLILTLIALILLSFFQYGYNFFLKKDIVKATANKESAFKSLVTLQSQLPNDSLLQKEKAKADKLIKALATKKQLLSILKNKEALNTNGFSNYLRVLGEGIPKGVWLTEFSIEKGGRKIKMLGQSLDAVSVLNLISNLDKDKIFDGRQFNLVSLGNLDDGHATISGSKVFTFEVTNE
jgi:Tfp pilus assembly protein PilN